MSINDKHDVISSLATRRPLTIEVGCGPRKRYEGSISIDQIDADTVDLVGDAREALRLIPADTADLVTSSHFFEHVEDVGGYLDEMARVLRPGGRIEVIVPHFAHPYYSSDPTHRDRFGLYTFSYFTDDRILRRRVPSYVRRSNLALRSVDLIFKSSPPFYARHGVRRIVGMLFNSCVYMRELHEEFFAHLFPAYEIRFVIEKVA